MNWSSRATFGQRVIFSPTPHWWAAAFLTRPGARSEAATAGGVPPILIAGRIVLVVVLICWPSSLGPDS
jgi:hypothetical protein